MVNHGLESLSYIGEKLWDSVPSHMKEIDSINEFKHVIKTWKPDLCSYRLCKVYNNTKRRIRRIKNTIKIIIIIKMIIIIITIHIYIQKSK